MAPVAEELETLIARRDPAVAVLARDLAKVLAEIRPDLDGAVKAGWGTVNYRHAAAGFVCAIYPARDHVSLVFQQGRLLSSPLLVDDGKVTQVRWIVLRPGDDIPVDEIAILIAEAIALRA